MQFIDIRKD